MKKILSFALAAVMAMSALPVAYAAEGEHDYSNGTQITLVGTQETQGAQWTVTVPAKMQPGQTGTVKAEGTWAADKFINVHAPKTVTLTYGAQSMDVGISWANESCGFSKIGSNTDTVTHSVDVTVAEANRLFGEWSGTLEYTVALIENGDVNRDGMITEDDETRLKQHLLTDPEKHVDLSAEGQQYADINGDGNLTVLDVVALKLALDSKCSPNAVNAVQPVETVLLGDVNGDGRVNGNDRSLMNGILANVDNDGSLFAADVNEDGVVNAEDSTILQEYVGRLPDTIAAYPNIGTEISISGKTVPTIEYYPNLVGDVTGDGQVNNFDASKMKQILGNVVDTTQINLVAADANGDKIINQTDADMINSYANSLPVEGSIVGQYRQDVDNSEYTIEYTTTE